ncbi:ATP-binding protein [Actinomadura scrupuli]|uniref:ATP-binding protein n=1 Tax=Actinomadura scrupuli TaxID=559629 RepID=UPI003D976AFD
MLLKDGSGMTAITDEMRMPMLASPASAGLARTLTGQRLGKWGCSHISEDTLIVVAELIGNATKETPNREIRFALRREPTGVLVAVWDCSPRPPRPAPVVELTLESLDLSEHNFDANGGRGLHLVAALSTEWGHHPDPIDPRTGRSPGKWVWARLHT